MGGAQLRPSEQRDVLQRHRGLLEPLDVLVLTPVGRRARADRVGEGVGGREEQRRLQKLGGPAGELAWECVRHRLLFSHAVLHERNVSPHGGAADRAVVSVGELSDGALGVEGRVPQRFGEQIVLELHEVAALGVVVALLEDALDAVLVVRAQVGHERVHVGVRHKVAVEVGRVVPDVDALRLLLPAAQVGEELGIVRVRERMRKVALEGAQPYDHVRARLQLARGR